MRLTHAMALALMVIGTPCFAQPVPPGARQVPAKVLPVPDAVSPQMQAIIAQPYNPTWNVVPKTPDEWKAIVDKAAAAVVATLPEIRDKLGATATA